jgi:hypothetical protein
MIILYIYIAKFILNPVWNIIAYCYKIHSEPGHY